MCHPEPFAALRVNSAKDLASRTPRSFASLRMTSRISLTFAHGMSFLQISVTILFALTAGTNVLYSILKRYKITVEEYFYGRRFRTFACPHGVFATGWVQPHQAVGETGKSPGDGAPGDHRSRGYVW